MVALLPDCDVLAGMELGGIPIATVMSQLTGLPTVFVREAAQTYGTRKAAEGRPIAGARVVVPEDIGPTPPETTPCSYPVTNIFEPTETLAASPPPLPCHDP